MELRLEPLRNKMYFPRVFASRCSKIHCIAGGEKIMREPSCHFLLVAVTLVVYKLASSFLISKHYANTQASLFHSWCDFVLSSTSSQFLSIVLEAEDVQKNKS